MTDKTNDAKKTSKKEGRKKKKEYVKEEPVMIKEVDEESTVSDYFRKGGVAHKKAKKKEEIKELATATEEVQEEKKETEKKEVSEDAPNPGNPGEKDTEDPIMDDSFEDGEEGSSPNKVVILGAIIAVVAIVLLIINIDRIIPPVSTSGSGKIVAEINGNTVTEEEFSKYYDFYFFVRGYPEEYKQILTKAMILNETLVNEKLLLQKAQDEGIVVTEQMVDAVLDETLQRLPVTKTEFEETLKENGFTLDDLREYYRTQLIIMELLNSSVAGDIAVSDEEAVDYYKNNTPLFRAGEEEIRVRHILVDSSEEAEELLEELEDGADFAELAEEKSADMSASRGGELGFITKGVTVPEFEEAAFKLEEGEISGVVETEFGYHIIKREPDFIPLEDVKDTIKEALLNQKKQSAVREYVEELRAEADIRISLEEANLSELLESVTPETSNPFSDTGDDVCKENGKPIIRLFSTTGCPHCVWIKNTYDRVVKEYADEGKIMAYHWELDTGDDTLTKEVEKEIPESEEKQYKKYNPRGSVPTFVFGCKYMRIGNSYEMQDDLGAEEAEFRKIIEELIGEEETAAQEEGVTGDAQVAEEETPAEAAGMEETGKVCIGERGLTGDTVIFYYAEWCSSCKEIKDNVEKLQGEGYNFEIVESSKADLVKDCFKDVKLAKVPQLICAGDGSTTGGALTELQLKEFAEGCE